MKEFKTYQEQIEILKSRGIVISNEEFALEKLQEDNYYNIINGYKDLFIDSNQYIQGTTFEEIYSLFEFDRNLKSILLKNILIVENILRTLIAYNFSLKYGNDNYLKIDNFETLKNSGCKKEKYQERIEQIQKLICNMQLDIANNIKKKPYINHYILNYGFVPLWVLVNAISLGRLNQFIKNLSYFRNLCAHDERVYSATINQPIPDTIYHYKLNLKKKDNNFIQGKSDLFSLIISLKMLLPNDKFNTMCNQIEGRMKSLEKKIFVINPQKIFDKMGFPLNWIQIKKS